MLEYAHPKCYAKSRNDCSTGISREHYLSRAILSELEKDGAVGVANIHAISQSHDAFTPIGISALSSKILCEKHNGFLSDLDNEAAKLFRTIDVFDKAQAGGQAIEISGNQIERWMLKLAFGVVHSGATSNSSNLKMKTECMDMLFNQLPLPQGWGTYIPSNTHHHTNISCRLSHHPETNEVLLIEAEMGIVRMKLVLGQPNSPDEVGFFRPSRLSFRSSKTNTNHINIDWEGSAHGKGLLFDKVGSYSGNVPPHWPEWAR